MRVTVEQITEAFRQNLEAFRRILHTTEPGRLTFKKDDSWWSVLEVVHHVARVNTSAAGSLGQLVEGFRAEPAGDAAEGVEIQDALENIDDSWVLSNLQAPPGSEPEGELSAPQAERLLEASHAGIKTLLELGQKVDLRGVTTPSKLFGTLNFYERVYFLARHEKTHLYQIKLKLAETVRS
ncbi:MAG: DinB family protein [Spirochaetales bacterium]|nr:DinB family protein [Spirochaetales bacterium]